jgi:PAS domain-containing protein
MDKDELYLSEKQHAVTAQLGLAALSTDRLRDFQQIILGKLINNLATDIAIIGRVEHSGKTLELFVARPKLLKKRSQPLTESYPEMSLEAIAMATDQPLLIEDFDNQDEFARPLYLSDEVRLRTRSAVVVPLKGYKEMLGTISVFSMRPYALDASDVHFLQSVASIFSLSIERRRSELELQNSREKLNIILHTIADGIFAQDKEGKILYANQAALNVSGYSFPDTVQNEVSEADQVTLLTEALTQIDFRDQDGNALSLNELPGAKALKTGQTQISSIQFSGPNHRRSHWALVKASPVFNDNQQVEYVVNVLTDITDLKQTELQLERYKERFELAQQSGSVGVFEWDIQHDLIWWSSGEEALFRIPHTFEDEFLNRQTVVYWQDRVHPMDRTRIRNKIMNAIKERQIEYENEFRILYPDGEIRWLKSMARITYSHGGKPLRMVGVNFDITDRIRKEQRKDEFISIASHELKTPLTSIKAFVQMLLKKITKDEIDKETFAQHLSRIVGQVNKLDKLVSDLLDITKVQQGKLQLDKKIVSMNEMLHEVISTFRQTHETHPVELVMEKEIQVSIDRHRIEQVIINLLTNAVKYSEDGSIITVRLRCDCGLRTM